MRAAVLGFGNVAAATIDSFMANQTLIAAKTRSPIRFVRVATRTPARAAGRVPDGCAVSDNCWGLVDDPQVDVVVELMGDVALGRQLVLRALANGKHVVTANKALLARHGQEIMAVAQQMGRSVLFEGAVAVSIPIIKTLRESAAANRISSITGILNGTSNYVLSQMSQEGVGFAAALADAQRMGYAEADPTLDVSGEDAAHKLTLLVALGFGVPIDFGVVPFQGIQAIDGLDIGFAKRLGYQIKLIAQACMQDGFLSVGVQPMLVPAASMLAQVGGSMNGIALRGDLLGSAFLYGSGAGGRQTASAVLADLMELANRAPGGTPAGAYSMGFGPGRATTVAVRQAGERSGAFYIRLRLDDRAGVLAKVSAVLAQADISVDVLLQDRALDEQSDLVVLTHEIAGVRLDGIVPALREAAGEGHCVVVYPVIGAH